jgi:hypothetical protein
VEILNLTLHKKWFDMILSGEKTEEYREIKKYWINRLSSNKYKFVKFTNGYGSNRSSFTIVLNDICVGKGNKEWGAPTGQDVYIIKLGKLLTTTNIN